MARPVTNYDLDALLREAGYDRSHAAFARQVNHASRDVGTFRYDAASVYWWLRGRQPDAAVQVAMAGVLGRRVCRPVRVEELGFDVTDAHGLVCYPATPAEAINSAAALWRTLARRHDLLDDAVFVPSIAVEAGFAWRFDQRDAEVSRSGRYQVSAADVVALQLYAGRFVDLDRRHGGGARSMRTVLTEFLHRQVTPLLQGSYSDKVGRSLFGAAAVLNGQLGFMSYDAGRHGAAQRHFVLALRMAKVADDRLYGAHVLANMATQAAYLGQAQTAVRLARAAVDGGRSAPAGVLARLHTAEATAHAVAGDRRACMSALCKAAGAVERSQPETMPGWVGYFSPAHFAGTAMRCFRDLGMYPIAIQHTQAALAVAHDNHRTRALHTALLASTYAHAGELDAACSFGDQAVILAATVQSTRVRERLAEVVSRLVPHKSDRRVTEFLQRSAPTLASS